MSDNHLRMRREKKTIEIMIKMYCRGLHGANNEVCQECSELLEYARLRLDKCPFQENKPTCAKCSIHCYKPPMKEKIASVMRYSGPRLIQRHPILTILHLLDGFRKVR